MNRHILHSARRVVQLTAALMAIPVEIGFRVKVQLRRMSADAIDCHDETILTSQKGKDVDNSIGRSG